MSARELAVEKSSSKPESIESNTTEGGYILVVTTEGFPYIEVAGCGKLDLPAC